jgi:hypothetical protein
MVYTLPGQRIYDVLLRWESYSGAKVEGSERLPDAALAPARLPDAHACRVGSATGQSCEQDLRRFWVGFWLPLARLRRQDRLEPGGMPVHKEEVALRVPIP